MGQEPQSLKNHTKFDPAFHFFLAPLALLMFFEAVWRMINNHDFYTAVHLVAVIWGVVAIFKMRLYSLKVQDRVIRLEEKLRLKELAPAALQGRIGELTEDQLIGLRFASDGEVAGLAQKALDGKWNRKQIKEAVKNWRPDDLRV
ncbi:MAG TPA: DUF6526 family protein [Bryobacteraceae bacterium]|jgi:hypothetical protein